MDLPLRQMSEGPILWRTDGVILMGFFDDDDIQKELDSYEEDGFTLAGLYTVVLAENKKDGTRQYLALDRKTGKPYANWGDHYRFDVLKLCMLDDERDIANIVRMAERKGGKE